MKKLINSILNFIIGYKNTLKLKLLLHGLKYLPIINFIDIDGWLSLNEAIALYNITLKLPNDKPIVVEIGSWQGKSSLILAKALNTKNSPKLFCIDPFNAEGDKLSKASYKEIQNRIKISLKNQFIHNMKKNNINEIIQILEGFSYNFCHDFKYTIDFLFIDGNHSKEAVLKDFEDWSPLIKDGGIIAFHDVSNIGIHKGPWLVVQEKIINNPNWKDVSLINSLFIATKTNN